MLPARVVNLYVIKVAQASEIAQLVKAEFDPWDPH